MRALAKRVLSWGLGTVLVAGSVLSGANARVPPRQSDALDWQTFTIPSFGTKVEYPAGIFEVSDGKSEQGVGERLRSADGRAVLTIYSRENDAAETPGTYLKNNRTIYGSRALPSTMSGSRRRSLRSPRSARA